MAVVSVNYPHSEGATFDYDYYTATHLPLVRTRWTDAGLVSAEAFRGVAGGDGGKPAYLAIAILRFASSEHLSAALGGAHAAEIIGDIPNFTNAQPILQVNEEIGKG